MFGIHRISVLNLCDVAAVKAKCHGVTVQSEKFEFDPSIAFFALHLYMYYECRYTKGFPHGQAENSHHDGKSLSSAMTFSHAWN